MNIIKAYSDCNSLGGERDLDYISENGLSPELAKRTMEVALGDSNYNNFTPSILDEFFKADPNGKVFLAREGSVALYWVGQDNPSIHSVIADEMDEVGFRGGMAIRYWWD